MFGGRIGLVDPNLARRSGRHEMDGKGATLTIGPVGWRVMQGLAVVEHDAACREFDGDRLVVVHGGTDVEKGRGGFRPVMIDWKPV